MVLLQGSGFVGGNDDSSFVFGSVPFEPEVVNLREITTVIISEEESQAADILELVDFNWVVDLPSAVCHKVELLCALNIFRVVKVDVVSVCEHPAVSRCCLRISSNYAERFYLDLCRERDVHYQFSVKLHGFENLANTQFQISRAADVTEDLHGVARTFLVSMRSSHAFIQFLPVPVWLSLRALTESHFFWDLDTQFTVTPPTHLKQSRVKPD